MSLIFAFIQGLIAFIIIISVLVFVHEFGHFLGCVICKVKVDSFSIGMGKELYGRTDKNGIRWKFSILPIGGYVKMFGDDDASSGKSDKKLLESMSEEDKKKCFYFQNVYKRFLIVFFGPFFNLVFSILLITFFLKIKGISYTKPIINEVLKDSPAQISGILPNDTILSINDKKINSFDDISHEIIINNLDVLNIEIERNSSIVNLQVQPKLKDSTDMFGNKIEIPYIGISSFPSEIQKISLWSAFYKSVISVYKMCKDALVMLFQIIIRKRGTDGLGGPIKIAKYSAQSFKAGFMGVIYFIALISANIGFMNLLPIPVLDGGHLFFFLIEIIFRKKIPDKIQEYLLNTGFALLLLIMIFTTFNDVKSFF